MFGFTVVSGSGEGSAVARHNMVADFKSGPFSRKPAPEFPDQIKPRSLVLQ
jgi:hypothetical protein